MLTMVVEPPAAPDRPEGGPAAAMSEMPPPYGAPPRYGYPAPPRPAGTNGFAVASLVLSIFWLLWFGSLLAVIFSFVAFQQIRASGELQRGRGLAIAGLVIGLIGLFALAITILVIANIPSYCVTNSHGVRVCHGN
jgi:hypothetical protein